MVYEHWVCSLEFLGVYSAAVSIGHAPWNPLGCALGQQNHSKKETKPKNPEKTLQNLCVSPESKGLGAVPGPSVPHTSWEMNVQRIYTNRLWVRLSLS